MDRTVCHSFIRLRYQFLRHTSIIVLAARKDNGTNEDRFPIPYQEILIISNPTTPPQQDKSRARNKRPTIPHSIAIAIETRDIPPLKTIATYNYNKDNNYNNNDYYYYNPHSN